MTEFKRIKEIIAQLSLLRVPMTERTLYNYSTWKLIPEPKRGSGRSGKWVEYPQEAMGEAYAAWKLLHGDYWGEGNYVKLGLKPAKIAPETVAATRKLVFEIENQDWSKFKRKPVGIEESVKFILSLDNVFDNAAAILLLGYMNLWKLFEHEARSRVREILDDPEY